MKYIIYLELEKEGLTQLGYLKTGALGKAKNTASLVLPFDLTEREFCDSFNNLIDATKALNNAVKKLNFGYFSSIRRVFEAVEYV